MPARKLRVIAIACFLSLGISAQAAPKAANSCTAAVLGVAFPDLLPDWRAKDVAEYRSLLEKINSKLPLDMRFSYLELNNILSKIAHGSSDDSLQLRSFVKEGEYSADPFLDIEKGLGEWTTPTHDWLKEILARPALTREQIEADRNSYAKPRSLNPIERHRAAATRKAVEAVEKQVGQKLFTTEEIDWAARTSYNTSYLLDNLAVYSKTLTPTSANVLLLKEKLNIVNRATHEGSRIGGTEILAAKLAVLNDKEIMEELDFYFDLAKQNKLSSRGDIVRARLLSWFEGKVSFQETLEKMMIEEVKSALEFYAGGGNPHYIGALSHYSLLTQMGTLRKEDGVEVTEKLVESIDWQEAKAELLGTVHMNLYQNPNTNEIAVFGVELKDSRMYRHFALETLPKFEGPGSGNSTVANANYRNLVSLEVRNIRETLVKARTQDAFPVEPADLREPLVTLSGSEGPSPFKVEPTELLIGRFALTQSEKEAQSREEMIESTMRVLGESLVGAPRGEYASIKLFNQDRQIVPGSVYLNLISSDSRQQVYTTELKVNRFARLSLTLARNLVSNSVTLKSKVIVGGQTLNIKSKEWTGSYKPAR
jgi:hypothetical protein